MAGARERRSSPIAGPGLRLLERCAEFEQLGAVIGALSSGEGTVLVIDGEAGIGKTALLDAAVARASEAAPDVLVARGGEAEQHHAFGVVRQLMEPALQALGERAREAVLSGAAGLGRSVLFGLGAPAAPLDSATACMVCTG
ncbi:MAG: AAA family ATPase [Solirubrobacteraceae bacterium]